MLLASTEQLKVVIQEEDYLQDKVFNAKKFDLFEKRFLREFLLAVF